MYSTKVRVRIVHKDYKQLLAIVEECRQEKYFDVVYCWTRLIAAHAFQHTAHCELMILKISLMICGLFEYLFKSYQSEHTGPCTPERIRTDTKIPRLSGLPLLAKDVNIQLGSIYY